jgi:Holliday junction resolvase RusA-like endonuclease
MKMLEFVVDGVAIPQGSKTVFNGRAVDANAKKLKPWRSEITLAAKRAAEHAGVTFERDESVVVLIQVFFLRPKTSKRLNPNVKPDADKLARSILDSISDAGVWADDCQVIDLRIIKGYTVDTPRTLICIKSS